MCRLAAFPPGTKPELAHEIVSSFAPHNDDGVGSCYLQGKSFVLQKYPISYASAVMNKKPLFDHMPYDGWTIAHVRLATHGKELYQNTHPIIRGNVAVAHNGIFYGAGLVRAALHKSVSWQGETDSEVGAYMLNSLGVDQFYKEMPTGAGVYLALHRDGSLSVSKTSGDFEVLEHDDGKYIVASEFPFKGGMHSRSISMTTGVAIFTPEGRPKNFKLEKKESNLWWEKNGKHGYTPKDIGFANFRKEQQQTTSNTTSTVTKSLQEAFPTLSLWDWPDDEKMMEYIRSLP